ncbi:hypothetical protein ACHQM5_023668 [Ranunculus cassubicifolius]
MLTAEEKKVKLESFYDGLFPCHAVIEGSSGECSEDDDEHSGECTEYYVYNTDDEEAEYVYCYGDDYVSDPLSDGRIYSMAKIPEDLLKNPAYKMAAQFAVEELQTKFNQEKKLKTRFELEDVVDGTYQHVAGLAISINLKVKDQDKNSYTFRARIYAFLTPSPANCKLELISGQLLDHLGDPVFMT